MLALFERVYETTGFDFRNYALPSLQRRVRSHMQATHVASVAQLQVLLCADPARMARFVESVTVHSTTMFRDPWFYVALRDQVIPLLRTYSSVRIWHAGCSTGEEVYSLAILLEESGLADRCRIYATDISEVALAKARAGIYSLAAVREFTQNYLKAGGQSDFSAYYTARYEQAILMPSLARRVVFARHNLVTDASFNAFNLILCRNVMIYFNHALQERVHILLYDSLANFGVLALGDKEVLRLSPRGACYDELDGRAKLYRRAR